MVTLSILYAETADELIATYAPGGDLEDAINRDNEAALNLLTQATDSYDPLPEPEHLH